MKVTSRLYKTIKEAVDKVQIIDTHEHLLQEKEQTAGKPDLFETFLVQYASSDLVSSGIPLEEREKVRDSRLPLEERWEIFKPFWENIQNTGYARAMNIAARDLYGVDGIREDTCRKLAARMEEANKPGLYCWVLREKSGIERIILDTSNDHSIEDIDQTIFSLVMRFQQFIMVRRRPDLEVLEAVCGRKIHYLNALINALKLEFDRVYRKIVGVKIGLAYMRTLRFDKVTFKEVEEVFNNIYRQETFDRITVDKRGIYIPAGLSLSESKPLQDFIVHKVIQFASERGLPIQTHTGLQEGNENIITNSNPTLLVNLFREYREARFDIFHGSYPYADELTVLAKSFQNVYIDVCWLHVISPYGARQALAEWLDTVPWNKIFGFGGDYHFIEGVYGHSKIARENIERVLVEKVEEGSFTEEQTYRLAQKLLRENANEFFFSNKCFEPKSKNSKTSKNQRSYKERFLNP